jgi:chromosome segregation ATPase
MGTEHKYYDRKISALQKELSYCKRDLQSLQKAFARLTWDSDNDCQLTLAQLRKEINSVEDRIGEK